MDGVILTKEKFTKSSIGLRTSESEESKKF